MSDLSHPCGALPVRGWSLNLWFCEHHQAYFASATAYRQDRTDEPSIVSSDRLDLGPFDTAADAERWLQARWLAWRPALPAPGIADEPAASVD